MSKVTLKEIKKIINDVGLNAEFRTVSSNKWSDIVNNGIDIPVFFIEHYVDYQTAVFSYLSKSVIVLYIKINIVILICYLMS